MGKKFRECVENNLFIFNNYDIINNIIEIELKCNFYKIDKFTLEKIIQSFKWNKLNNNDNKVSFKEENLVISYDKGLVIELKIDFKSLEIMVSELDLELMRNVVNLSVQTSNFNIVTSFDITKINMYPTGVCVFYLTERDK